MTWLSASLHKPLGALGGGKKKNKGTKELGKVPVPLH